jgi:hypothetical protein
MSTHRCFPLAGLFVGVVLLTQSTGQTADTRLPVPAPLDIAKADNTVKDVFKVEYTKTKFSERAAFALKLLQQAAESKGDPAAQYALLREARDIAAKVADAATALKAAAELAETFRINRSEAYLPAVDSLVASSASPTAIKATTEALQALAEDLVAIGEWDAAIKVLNGAEAAAKKGTLVTLSTAIRTRFKQVEAIKAEAAKIDAHRFTLRDNPEEPVANAAVGRFLCFVTKDWDAGVPLLAKGDDAMLKDAASKDLKAGKGTDVDQLTAGDSWYDLAATADAAIKPAIQSRALHWYSQAVSTLTGLSKAKAEARVKELTPPAGKFDKNTTVWNEIRTAITAKKLKRWEIVGSTSYLTPYEDLPPNAMLVGFNYTTRINGMFPDMVQPIYQTEKGEVSGKIFGSPAKKGTALTTKAKPGYAVGAILTKGGNGFDSFKPIFMKINGRGLNVNDQYDGDTVGNSPGITSGTLGGDGNFIVGLHGRLASNGYMKAVSPITLTTLPPVAKKP